VKPLPRKSFFGHPAMLANLFSVELWERFSFYGMQGILLYYMYFTVADGGLGIDRSIATGLVGAYGGGVYLSTILGAWIADRVFGSERVLFYSAIMIMCGHISLAVLPGGLGLAAGLILVGIGSGGLKANATSLVGTLYAEGDERRDAGFSIFYMGINIGALIGPLVTGWLQKNWGFHVGFGAAAVGMAIGLTQYAMTRKNLPDEAHHVTNHRRGLHDRAGNPGEPGEGGRWPGHPGRRRLLRFAADQSQGGREGTQPRPGLHPPVHRVGSVLGAVPAAVHRGGHLFAGEPGPELLRLDHAAQLRAVHQPHLHHHLRGCVRPVCGPSSVPGSPARR
jgi:MFS family permease